MSRSSVGAVATPRYGHRTSSPVRINDAHQRRAFDASIPGRKNVHSTPESSISFSICSGTFLTGFGC